MSEAPPRINGCLHILSWLVAAALVAAIAPIAFGRGFEWEPGVLVLVLGGSGLVARYMWITRDGDTHSSPIPVESERVLGSFEVSSGELVVADGPPLGDELRLDGLPSGPWRVTCSYRSGGPAEETLCRVTLQGALPDESLQMTRHEYCVDAGRFVVLDGAVPALEAEHLVAVDDGWNIRQGAVRLICGRDGVAKGIVIAPPYGDGAYEFCVSVETAGVCLSIEF